MIIMESKKLINSFLRIAKEIKDSELSKDKKLFLVSAIWVVSYKLIESQVNYYFSNIYKSYLSDDKEIVKYVLYSCDKEITIDFAGDIEECAKTYYNLLSENEKLQSIHLLNKLPKIFLEESKCTYDVHRNLYNLVTFFDKMYYVTNGDFKYDENVFYYLLKANKYKVKKAFFNALASNIASFRTNIFRTDNYLNEIDYIEKMLNATSVDFNMAMAKLLLK